MYDKGPSRSIQWKRTFDVITTLTVLQSAQHTEISHTATVTAAAHTDRLGKPQTCTQMWTKTQTQCLTTVADADAFAFLGPVKAGMFVLSGSSGHCVGQFNGPTDKRQFSNVMSSDVFLLLWQWPTPSTPMLGFSC